MSNENDERLKRLLEKRRRSQSSIENFDSQFVLFSRKTLRDVIDRIESTDGFGSSEIKLYYDDPFRFTPNNSYLVYLVLIGEKPKPITTDQFNNSIDIITSQMYSSSRGRLNGPSIKFEGSVYSGEVTISFNVFGMDPNRYEEHDKKLVDELEFNTTYKIVVDFFEKLYA
ncbi:hypothetical protein GGR28_003792 [Lewinella aquimaris]|uniref:Uncharacterized protein n=1 Tax=Neolewinella aquimaris TaxID=1835722 RepID=A0A840E651_9BACT|nr:hypothetical protein [Neolewinella aquimaris]MBB4081144.1 hypothetical protein [Neolewinella aquimaris]